MKELGWEILRECPYGYTAYYKWVGKKQDIPDNTRNDALSFCYKIEPSLNGHYSLTREEGLPIPSNNPLEIARVVKAGVGIQWGEDLVTESSDDND